MPTTHDAGYSSASVGAANADVERDSQVISTITDFAEINQAREVWVLVGCD